LLNQTLTIFNDDGIDLSLESSEKEIWLATDGEQFQRSIINMIRNSIQANSKKIFVSVRQIATFIELKICDNGIGIPVGLREKIFDRSYSTKKDGMGIGLYLTKRFVESMNGKIEIEESNEFSTIIKITFPI